MKTAGVKERAGAGGGQRTIAGEANIKAETQDVKNGRGSLFSTYSSTLPTVPAKDTPSMSPLPSLAFFLGSIISAVHSIRILARSR